MFYKTLNGAQVGDLFMCLIHTCELNGANSFDYLTELQRHCGGCGARAYGLDTVELPRDSGEDIIGRRPRGCVTAPEPVG